MARIIILAYGRAQLHRFLPDVSLRHRLSRQYRCAEGARLGPVGPLGTALLVDLALLALFAIQHSVMARPAFKAVFTRVVPAAAERSTYELASSLALMLLFWKWQPLGGEVWKVQSNSGRALFYGGFAFGWALLLYTTFVINHFDLFGLRQVWRRFAGQPQAPLSFVTPPLYRMTRHPLYVGWLLTFWCTPTMTISHLLFAAVAMAYIVVAIQFEEHDLMQAHPEYAEYRRQVPMLMPTWPRQLAPRGRIRASEL